MVLRAKLGEKKRKEIFRLQVQEDCIIPAGILIRTGIKKTIPLTVFYKMKTVKSQKES